MAEHGRFVDPYNRFGRWIQAGASGATAPRSPGGEGIIRPDSLIAMLTRDRLDPQTAGSWSDGNKRKRGSPTGTSSSSPTSLPTDPDDGALDPYIKLYNPDPDFDDVQYVTGDGTFFQTATGWIENVKNFFVDTQNERIVDYRGRSFGLGADMTYVDPRSEGWMHTHVEPSTIPRGYYYDPAAGGYAMDQRTWIAPIGPENPSGRASAGVVNELYGPIKGRELGTGDIDLILRDARRDKRQRTIHQPY